MRGLAALLPTLITLWLLFWVWNFLWENLGRHVIWFIKYLWVSLQDNDMLPESWRRPAGHIGYILQEGPGLEPSFGTKLLGVLLAIFLVYVIGVFVGNLIGRTMWRIAEGALMKLPLIRAIYPSVKQVTDFLLREKKAGQFGGASRVVAVQARAQGIWAIGLVTGEGYGPLNEAIRGEMLTIFIPSSPTAVAGYVVVAHREAVVELPLTVEEALRLLISGGVIVPQGNRQLLPPDAFGALPKPAPSSAAVEPRGGQAAASDFGQVVREVPAPPV